jgi:hypothetical protein
MVSPAAPVFPSFRRTSNAKPHSFQGLEHGTPVLLFGTPSWVLELRAEGQDSGTVEQQVIKLAYVPERPKPGSDLSAR